MKALLAAFLTVSLALLAGCNHTKDQDAETPRPGVKFGRIVALYDIIDRQTLELVGYLEKYRYHTGDEIYWVKPIDREMNLGYITADNRAFKYVTHAGQRAPKAEFIGADRISTNARRISGHDRPVKIVEISLQDYADRIAPPPAADEPAPDGEMDGDGEDDG